MERPGTTKDNGNEKVKETMENTTELERKMEATSNLIKVLIKQYKFREADKTAKRKGGYNQEELLLLAENLVKRKDLMLSRASEESKKENRAESCHIVDELKEKGASREIFEEILKNFINSGALYESTQIAENQRRELTPIEIDLLVRSCIKKGEFSATEIMAELGASQGTIDLLVESYFKEINFHNRTSLNEIIKIAELGDSKKILEKLLKFLIKEGEIEDAYKVIDLLGRELTLEEIEDLTQAVEKIKK